MFRKVASWVAVLSLCVLPAMTALAIPQGEASSALRLDEPPSARLISPASKLPFSFEEIAAYFTQAMESPPTKLGGNCVVFTQSTPEGMQGLFESTIITVTGVEDGVSVTLLTNADYGMNYFREFIESPLFLPEESERFYYLLYSAPGPDWVEMFRFRVQLNVMETADWEILGLTFRPLSTSHPAPVRD